MGKQALFASDVARAWQLTKESGQSAAQVIPLQVRYAFMRASLNSLADNIPAAMVGGLLKAELWQPAQALAYAQQTQNPWRRAEYLVELVPYVPQALLPEVLITLDQIWDTTYRSFVLARLARRFSELWPKVLKTVARIQDKFGSHRRSANGFSYRAYALKKLLPDLPEQYFAKALDITRQIDDKADRASALIAIAKHLPEHWPEALEVTRQITDESQRAYALIEIAKYLPESHWPKILELTRQITDESQRAYALRFIAKHLPEQHWPETMTMIWQIKDNYHCASALGGMLIHLHQLPITLKQMSVMLDTLAHRNRQQLVRDFANLRHPILALGDKETLAISLRAIKEVCNQWP